MPIPEYHQITLPLLRLLESGKELSMGEAVEALSQEFRLSPDARKEKLPSGRQAKFDNRVGWARTYLKKAKLIESPERGRVRITQRGLAVLLENPLVVDRAFLSRFPEFRAFLSGAPDGIDAPQPVESSVSKDVDRTPQDLIEAGYTKLQGALISELLERVKSCSPSFFERLVVHLLVKMGYGGTQEDAGRAVGQTNDGGIDGIIKEDRLGLDVIYIQAKRWEGSVGRPTVQAFAGSLEGQRARKGILITTSHFTQEAKDYVTRIEKKIVLINGQHLAELMIEFGVGVSEEDKYVLHRIDLDFFEDEL